MTNKLTQARLKDLLSYDPATGVFVWEVKRRGARGIGIAAGNIHKITGYRRIGIECTSYLSSRLAHLYMEGYFPENDMDHIDRNRSNDRRSNLRHVSHQCNVRNCSLSKKNRSGVTGVYWGTTRKKWIAKIMVDGKRIHLGRFADKTASVKARWEAEKKYNFPNCNTTSSAYQYLIALKEVEHR